MKPVDESETRTGHDGDTVHGSSSAANTTHASSTAAPNTLSAAGGSPHAEPEDAPDWSRWITGLSIVVAAVALTITVWTVGPRALWHQLGTIGWGFGLVILVEIFITWCDATALHLFVGRHLRRINRWFVLRAQVAGRAVNALTPLASLGEATKVTMLMQRVSGKAAVTAVLRYNLGVIAIKLAMLALGAPLCALALDLPTSLTTMLWISGGIALGLLGFGAWLVHFGLIRFFVGAGRALHLLSRERAKRWRAKVKAVDKATATWMDQPGGNRWAPVGWLALSRGGSMLSTWVLLASAGHILDPLTIAAMSTVGLLIALPASLVPMGIGVAEGANAALYAALGASPALGVTMTLASRITSVLYAFIGTIISATDVKAAVVPPRAKHPPRPDAICK